MTITARYASRCARCGQQIAAGSQIEWSKGSPTTHVGACPEFETVASVLQSASAATQRRSLSASLTGLCRKCGSYCYGDCEASQSSKPRRAED